MTTPQEQTYQALRRAMLRAQDASVRIVCEAFEVASPRPGGNPAGVCALGADNFFGDRTPLPLPEDEAGYCDAYDEIQRGFDGLRPPPNKLMQPWHAVGLRLRDEFRPITATALERELEGT